MRHRDRARVAGLALLAVAYLAGCNGERQDATSFVLQPEFNGLRQKFSMMIVQLNQPFSC